MIAKATAEIAQTPAARPSTPSEKLTTFISATRPSTVSTPPSAAEVHEVEERSVMLSTETPELHEDSAAATWPSSFAAGGSSRSRRAPRPR